MTYTNRGYTEADIIEALDTIRYICKEYEDCKNCPFTDGGEICHITNENPAYWNVKKETVWCAFE